MKLTTKGRFAVTALLDMALNSDDNYVPITLYNISERQGISLSYLEQLFVKLRRAGLVKSYKGPGGGYVLAKNLNLLTVSDIINVVDDDMDARICRGLVNCKGNQKCLAHDLWDGLTKHVYSYLEKITLQDLITNQQKTFIQPQIVFTRN
ncbi:MAG: Rrf2 family transcriptional regulator [Neisseriaceae bacterium]